VPGSAEVDRYIAALPEDRQGPMRALRAAIRAAAPDAEEVITYKMPGFRSHGQFLVSYDAYKRHYSLFPASEAVIQAVGERLRPHLSGSGTIQFRRDQSLPLDMITRIVEIRYAENAARAEQEGGR
jgi:uncharacterized protein YdhG (YjbR/CyaY superfamily)